MALIKAKEAAMALATTPQRVYELVRTGVIPPGVAVRLGRQVRFDDAALAEWIRKGGQALPGGWRHEVTAPPPPSRSSLAVFGKRYGR